MENVELACGLWPQQCIRNTYVRYTTVAIANLGKTRQTCKTRPTRPPLAMTNQPTCHADIKPGLWASQVYCQVGTLRDRNLEATNENIYTTGNKVRCEMHRSDNDLQNNNFEIANRLDIGPDMQSKGCIVYRYWAAPAN
jgi:hypothetical protein